MKAKYSKRLLNKICTLVKKGNYTIAELCANVGISEGSYYLWRKTFVEFEEKIHEAEEVRLQFFVSESKKSLLKKIQGYTVQEKKTVTIDSGKKDEFGKPIPKIKEQSVTDRYFQPDGTLIMFMLTNKDGENFKNKQNMEVTGKDGNGIEFNVTIKKKSE